MSHISISDGEFMPQKSSDSYLQLHRNPKIGKYYVFTYEYIRGYNVQCV